MTEVFGKNYASAYDSLYRNKDYEGEVDLIERLLRQHGQSGPRHLLDLGCGTGNHAIPLARRGHTVVGVDRSASMLAHARTKAATMLPAGAVRPEFYEGDVSKIALGKRFDAAIMMFAVMGYLYEDADFTAALKTVRRHLNSGGLFIFDVWNGLAVLADNPRDRTVTVADGDARIIRKTRVKLDAPRHICHVNFDLQRTDAAGRVEESTEEHVMRYFFPDELESALRDNGFGLLQIGAFPNIEQPADAKAWNAIAVAQAQ